VILIYSEALILKMSTKKIIKIYLRQDVAIKMFRDGSATSTFGSVDFFPIGKYTSLGQILFSK
jgi:hypothetical protein